MTSSDISFESYIIQTQYNHFNCDSKQRRIISCKVGTTHCVRIIGAITILEMSFYLVVSYLIVSNG